MNIHVNENIFKELSFFPDMTIFVVKFFSKQTNYIPKCFDFILLKRLPSEKYLLPVFLKR